MAWITLTSWTAGAALCLAGPTEDPNWWTVEVRSAMESITQEKVTDHVSFLASDEMKGRDTPSPELDRAAEYLKERFVDLGLEAPTDAGYMQSVDFPGLQLLQDGTVLRLERGGDVIEIGDESRVALTPATGDGLSTASELVILPMFFSEGAPRGLQLAGRVVVAPAPTEAAGAEESATAAYMRSSALTAQGLRRMIARTGCAALLVVASQDSSGDEYFGRMQAEAGLPFLQSRRRRGPSPGVFVVRDAKLDALLEAGKGGTEAAQVEWRGATQKPHNATASNVAAVLRGSDPLLRDQYIVVSAHYDHVGVGSPRDGDAIYNGADDDATGTTAVLCLAEALSRLPEPPRRSVLFLGFCGEEKGLVGSRAYVETPLIPLAQTVANLNIEMVGRPDDIGPNRAWVTGYEFSDLGEILREAAAVLDFEVYRHDVNSARLFGASDNASFARAGVPAHSISAGSLHPDYHQPSDEVERLDLPNMTRTIRALFVGLYRLAERDDPPAWDEETPTGRKYAEIRGGR